VPRRRQRQRPQRIHEQPAIEQTRPDHEQRDCARGEWCADRKVETIDGDRIVTPAKTYRAFCETDWRIIAACLRNPDGNDLSELAFKLAAAVTQKIAGDVSIRVPFGPSVPLRLDVDACLRGMADRLAKWERRVQEVARLSAQQGPRHAAAAQIDRAAGLLHTHLTTLLGLQPEPMELWLPLPRPIAAAEIVSSETGRALVMLSGADAGNDILWMHWLARAVLQETPPKRELLIGVPCRNKTCGLMTLWRAQPPQHDGDPEYWSECRSCHHQMTRDEYDEWVKMNAAYQRAIRRTPVLEGGS
jgi:hypothetical protein